MPRRYPNGSAHAPGSPPTSRARKNIRWRDVPDLYTTPTHVLADRLGCSINAVYYARRNGLGLRDPRRPGPQPDRDREDQHRRGLTPGRLCESCQLAVAVERWRGAWVCERCLLSADGSPADLLSAESMRMCAQGIATRRHELAE